MKKEFLISIFIFLFLILGTIVVVLYGEGYTINIQSGHPQLSGTGLLVATSSPDGAKVLINGHLTTATNNTLNLAPGNYQIEISKEGYFPWRKTITIKNQVVSKADALLFPNAPQLQNLTSAGAYNPIVDPSLTKIAYTVSSQSAQKNGVYVFNMNGSNLLMPEGAETQITNDTTDFFSDANLSWSPDGQSLLATVSANAKTTTYLLQANQFNQTPQDVTETLNDVNLAWNKQIAEKKLNALAILNPKLRKIVKENFDILSWSPNENKILYTASNSATIPQIITPPLIGVDSIPQQKNIEQGKIYVYDIKEDRNYSIQGQVSNANLPPIRWLADNKHLLLVENNKIEIEEYDGSNKTTIYAGPFVGNFAYSWPDSSKIVILTNLGNDQITPNLYTIGLK